MVNDRTKRRLARMEQQTKGAGGKHVFASLGDLYAHLQLIGDHRRRAAAGECAFGEGLSAAALQLMADHDRLYGQVAQ